MADLLCKIRTRCSKVLSKNLYILFVLFFAITNFLNAQNNDRFLSIHKYADLIVFAKVNNTDTRWVTDSRGKHIYTYADIQVNKVIKGSSIQSYIRLETVGGEIDGIGETSSESYHIAKGEEYILLLNTNPVRVINGNQGIIPINDNKIYLEKNFIQADEFIKLFTEVINGNAVINNAREFENAIIARQARSAVLPSQELKQLLLEKKNSLQNGQMLAAPDLRPYKPASWSDKIVIKNVSIPVADNITATDDSPVYDSQTLYIALCYANYGDAAAGAFSVKYYIDNVESGTLSTSGLESGYYQYYYNISIGSLSAGTHTIKMVLDSGNAVAESDETNNEYSRTVTVSHLAGTPLISSITPSSASAGTGTSITITGSGFGATQGTSTVEFFYKSGQAKLPAAVYTSWSDAQIVCQVPIGTVSGYAASAASGPVTVTNSSGTSNGYNFTVPFGYGGIKWPGSYPVVSYKINENYAGTTGEKDALVAAMNAWNGAGANFLLNYGGTSSVTTSSQDGENSITFGSTGGSLATNYYWYYTSSSTIIESDIVFNSDGFTFSTDGSAGTYDIQTVVTHEYGHTLNLRDLYGTDSDKMMYGFVSIATLKRSLSASDISGIQYIYGTGGSLTTYTISGTITSNGTPMSGVLVTLSGSSNQTFTTTSTGTYSFTSLPTGNYTVTPTKTGFVFTPASQTFNSLSANQTQNFTSNQFTVTTASSPAGGGSTAGGGTYSSGASVTVTATPNAGYSFVNWTENSTQVSTSASYTFTLSANRTLTANFAVTQYTVATSSNPSGGGVTAGGGTFNSGASVTVTATANSGYSFTNWTENGTQVSTSASYTFTISGNRTLVANFANVQYTVTTVSSPANGGTSSGGGTFNSGASVTVTATANSGYTFTNWTESGTQVSTSASYTFTLSGNRSLTANFTQLVPAITVNPSSLAFGDQTINISSTARSFSVSGTNLTANVTITSPAGFYMSLTETGTYASQLTVPVSGSTLASTLVYVKFTPAAVSAYSGSIISSSTGALNQNVAVTGNGINAVGIEKSAGINQDWYLFQNYPNPFNPTTIISYKIAQPCFVTVKIYNSLMEEVETIVSDYQNSGLHQVNYNAAGLPSGVYFYKIIAGQYSQVKKLILLK